MCVRLPLSRKNSVVRCMQAPYDVKVTGPSYLSLLDISNAQPLSNVTNGTIDLRVAQPYQNLDPNYGNRVNVTLVLSTSSQVNSWYRVTALDANAT